MRAGFLLMMILGLVGPPTPGGGDTREETIRAVMRKIHGKGGLASRAYPLLREPDCRAVTELAGEWQAEADLLARCPPRKGDPARFRQRAEGYRQAVKRFGAAVGREDRKEAFAALIQIAGTCKACHASHR